MIHTRGYSTFSFLDGLAKPSVYTQKAQEYGFSACALTEKYYMAGAIPFMQAAKKSGIRPIVGVELGFVGDQAGISNTQGTITLIATSPQGYQHLMALSTLAHTHIYQGIPSITTQDLLTHKEGVCILWGGRGSRIISACKQQDPLANQVRETLGSQREKQQMIVDYILAPHDQSIIEENALLESFANKYGYDHVINNGFCYPDAQDTDIFAIGQAIKTNKKIMDIDQKLFLNRHFLTQAQRRQMAIDQGFSLKDINQADETSESLAARCEYSINFGVASFPNYETQPVINELYSQFHNHLATKKS